MSRQGQRIRDWMGGVERAVTPVIGVILIVAIVVVIAASLGAVVFGFTGDIGDPAPAVAFEFEKDGNSLLITHTSGPSISKEDVRVDVYGKEHNITVPDEMSAGSSIEIDNESDIDGVNVLYGTSSQSSKLASTGDTSGTVAASAGSLNSGSSATAGPEGSASLGTSFVDDPSTESLENEITLNYEDENGDPVNGATITLEIIGDGNVTGGASTLQVDGNIVGTSGTIDATTDSNGEFVEYVRFAPGSLDSGTIVRVRLENTATGDTETIKYEIQN